MRVDLHINKNIQILDSVLIFLEMMCTINISHLTIRIKFTLGQMTKSYYLKMKKAEDRVAIVKKE